MQKIYIDLSVWLVINAKEGRQAQHLAPACCIYILPAIASAALRAKHHAGVGAYAHIVLVNSHLQGVSNHNLRHRLKLPQADLGQCAPPAMCVHPSYDPATPCQCFNALAQPHMHNQTSPFTNSAVILHHSYCIVSLVLPHCSCITAH